MIKAVIFDMDGVLINTEPLHYQCWVEIFKERYGIDLDYDVYINHALDLQDSIS